jgi:hypothetical protein
VTPRIDMRITSLLEKIIVIEHEMQTSLSISKRKAEGEPGFDFVVRDTLQLKGVYTDVTRTDA